MTYDQHCKSPPPSTQKVTFIYLLFKMTGYGNLLSKNITFVEWIEKIELKFH